MAKELKFTIAGTEYGASPVKLERKKIYGWSDMVATDKSGDVCSTVYLSLEDNLLIPSGGYKQGTVDDAGRWVERSELIACDKDGNPLPLLESSFDTTIELKDKVPHCVTIRRAMSDTWRKSALAPVVTSWITSSSATLPPSDIQILSTSLL